MTPEEHYQRGVDLLVAAEARPSDDPAGAQTLAAIAHGHFTAAAAGAGMRAMEFQLQFQRTAEVGPPAPGASDG